MSTLDPTRPIPAARNTSSLGAGLIVKGEVTGQEDLRIDGNVEGPVNLEGHRLTVGLTGHLNSTVAAREVVVYGSVKGNLRARDRIEIKKDGSVTGDLTAARVQIEDGACFNGKIQIDRGNGQGGANWDNLLARDASKST